MVYPIIIGIFSQKLVSSMLVEEWRTIEDYPNYEVSNLGEVRNIKKGNLLTPYPNTKGYLYVTLGKGNHKRIHRLVASAFPEICGKNFEDAQVDHINGNKTDNKAINLRFCTGEQNMHNPNTLFKTTNKVVQLDNNGNLLYLYLSVRDAERYTGVKNSHISEILNGKGKRKTAGGFKWQYMEDYMSDWWDTQMDEDYLAN